jgi:hypothetical protein
VEFSNLKLTGVETAFSKPRGTSQSGPRSEPPPCFHMFFPPVEFPVHSQNLIFDVSYLSLVASTYFHLPVDEEEDKDIESYERKYITWVAEASGASSSVPPSVSCKERSCTMNQVLSNDDLYEILGISKSSSLDKIALRRAYLSRSRACHPESVILFSSLDDIPNIPRSANSRIVQKQHMPFKRWQ